tara:strand:+ start:6839 stop:7579 length:741 start_codon:yes stop_codon:yes gene_type:complete
MALTEEHISSANPILNILFKYYLPKKIIDVGCGSGSWLHTAQELGAQSITGIDGLWLKKEMLVSNQIELISHDLEIPFPDLGKYDLAISLEVAEHLTENRAKSFIKDLCKLSKVILFSAAIPGQGGDHHINEQWQSFWCGLFRDNDYKCFDIIRHKVWNNSEVKSWYKQNCLVYVHKDLLQTFNESEKSKFPLDIVHNEIFILNPEKFKYLPIIRTLPENYKLWRGLTIFLSVLVIVLLFLLITVS